mmetsp:Transcript_22998/g.55419  ORF Transcript_22998/g.55419 Transcript_22998/m.55419 type:complete len:235 (+) Transcript_22998:495-1199(+)
MRTLRRGRPGMRIDHVGVSVGIRTQLARRGIIVNHPFQYRLGLLAGIPASGARDGVDDLRVSLNVRDDSRTHVEASQFLHAREQGQGVIGRIAFAAVGPGVDEPIEGAFVHLERAGVGVGEAEVVAGVVVVHGHAEEGLGALSQEVGVRHGLIVLSGLVDVPLLLLILLLLRNIQLPLKLLLFEVEIDPVGEIYPITDAIGLRLFHGPADDIAGTLELLLFIRIQRVRQHRSVN